jgi:hypothetical protein
LRDGKTEENRRVKRSVKGAKRVKGMEERVD